MSICGHVDDDDKGITICLNKHICFQRRSGAPSQVAKRKQADDSSDEDEWRPSQVGLDELMNIITTSVNVLHLYDVSVFLFSAGQTNERG